MTSVSSDVLLGYVNLTNSAKQYYGITWEPNVGQFTAPGYINDPGFLYLGTTEHPRDMHDFPEFVVVPRILSTELEGYSEYNQVLTATGSVVTEQPILRLGYKLDNNDIVYDCVTILDTQTSTTEEGDTIITTTFALSLYYATFISEGEHQVRLFAEFQVDDAKYAAPFGYVFNIIRYIPNMDPECVNSFIDAGPTQVDDTWSITGWTVTNTDISKIGYKVGSNPVVWAIETIGTKPGEIVGDTSEANRDIELEHQVIELGMNNGLDWALVHAYRLKLVIDTSTVPAAAEPYTLKILAQAQHTKINPFGTQTFTITGTGVEEPVDDLSGAKSTRSIKSTKTSNTEETLDGTDNNK